MRIGARNTMSRSRWTKTETHQVHPTWHRYRIQHSFSTIQISRHFPTFPDISRHFPDSSRHFLTVPDISRHFPDISRHFPTFSRHFPTSPDIFRHLPTWSRKNDFPTFPDISRHFPTFPDNPDCGNWREIAGALVVGDLIMHSYESSHDFPRN